MLGYAVVEERTARERILDLDRARGRSRSAAKRRRRREASSQPDAPAEPARSPVTPRPKPRHRPSDRCTARHACATASRDRGPAASPVVPQPPPSRAGRAPEQRPAFQRPQSPVFEPGPAPGDRRAGSRPASATACPSRVEPPAPPRREPQPPERTRSGRARDPPAERGPGLRPETLQARRRDRARPPVSLAAPLRRPLSQLRTIDNSKFRQEATVIGTVWDIEHARHRQRPQDGHRPGGRRHGRIADDVVQPVDRKAAAGRPGLFVWRQGGNLPEHAGHAQPGVRAAGPDAPEHRAARPGLSAHGGPERPLAARDH